MRNVTLSCATFGGIEASIGTSHRLRSPPRYRKQRHLQARRPKRTRARRHQQQRSHTQRLQRMPLAKDEPAQQIKRDHAQRALHRLPESSKNSVGKRKRDRRQRGRKFGQTKPARQH
jgi:hypothetical protein